MKTYFPVLAALLLVGVAAACSETAADTASDTTALTSDQLAELVLGKDEFGPDYAHLTSGANAGVLGDAGLASVTLDPDDTGTDIAAQGHISTYEASFTDESVLEPGGTGVHEVASSVSVFQDSDYARAFVAKEVADGERLSGQDLGDFVLESFLAYNTEGIGDEATGYTAGFRFGDQRVYTTVVVFRHGSLLGTTTITTTGTGYLDQLVEEWALILEGRIAASAD